MGKGRWGGGGGKEEVALAQGHVMQSSDTIPPSRGAGRIFFLHPQKQEVVKLSGCFRIACDGSGSCRFCICPKE